jgi:hypothetical protein
VSDALVDEIGNASELAGALNRRTVKAVSDCNPDSGTAGLT